MASLFPAKVFPLEHPTVDPEYVNLASIYCIFKDVAEKAVCCCQSNSMQKKAFCNLLAVNQRYIGQNFGYT